MIPINGPLLFPPLHCSTCEYFFMIEQAGNVSLGCCIIFNTHIAKSTPCCPWRFNVDSKENALAWSKVALPWIKAFIEFYNGDKRAVEIIMLENLSKENPNEPEKLSRKNIDVQKLPHPRTIKTDLPKV